MDPGWGSPVRTVLHNRPTSLSSPKTEGVCQGCILSLCLFNLYAEYIMRNTGLKEAQAGIKMSRRNINILRYATLMAESEEEVKSLLMKLKEENEKVGF